MSRRTYTETTKSHRTVYIFAGRYSNETYVDVLSLIEGDGSDYDGSMYPAVQIVPGNLPNTKKAVLLAGIESEAAFVCEGDQEMRNWAMASGTFIEIRDGKGHTEMIPLHNRYETVGGGREGESRRRA